MFSSGGGGGGCGGGGSAAGIVPLGRPSSHEILWLVKGDLHLPISAGRMAQYPDLRLFCARLAVDRVRDVMPRRISEELCPSYTEAWAVAKLGLSQQSVLLPCRCMTPCGRRCFATPHSCSSHLLRPG